MSEPECIIEKYRHGWLFCSSPGKNGIPLEILTACASKISKKHSVIHAGIVHHFNAVRYPANSRAVFAVSDSKQEADAWAKEIEQDLSHCTPHEAWWFGTDVGTSSASIFSALCPDATLRSIVQAYARGTAPYDADDLGRCIRLVEKFPSWKDRLDEVAELYPDTIWTDIARRWSELIVMDKDKLFHELQSMRTRKEGEVNDSQDSAV